MRVDVYMHRTHTGKIIFLLILMWVFAFLVKPETSIIGAIIITIATVIHLIAMRTLGGKMNLIIRVATILTILIGVVFLIGA